MGLLVRAGAFLSWGVVLAALSSKPLSRAGGLFTHWPLVIPAAVTLGMYALVHTEYRYVASFIGILWIGVFAGIQPAAEPRSRRVLRAALLGTGLVLAVQLGAEAAANIAYTLQQGNSGQP